MKLCHFLYPKIHFYHSLTFWALIRLYPFNSQTQTSKPFHYCYFYLKNNNEKEEERKSSLSRVTKRIRQSKNQSSKKLVKILRRSNSNPIKVGSSTNYQKLLEDSSISNFNSFKPTLLHLNSTLSSWKQILSNQMMSDWGILLVHLVVFFCVMNCYLCN